MIITAHTGTNFKGVLAYVYRENKKLPEDQKPIILEENLVWGNSSLQASLMNKVTEKNSNSSRPVLHITVSYPENEKLNQEEINKHLKEIVKDFGATDENNQYTITAHKDSAKDIANGTAHYHIVINKVGLNGQNINTNFIQNKAHVIADKLEKQFNLEKTIGRKIIYEPENDKGWRFTSKQERAEVAQAKKSLEKAPIIREKRKNVKKETDKIEVKIFQVLVSQRTLAKTPEEFVSTLAEKGIEVRFSYDKENNNAIRGASFKSDKIKVGGAKIGYNWDYINAHLEQNKAFYLKNAVPAQPVQQSFKNEQKAKDIVYEKAKKHAIIIPTVAKVKTATEKIAEKMIGKGITQSGKEVLKTAKTPEEFKQKLAEKGITVDFTLQAKGISGVKFTQNGISFKGSDIGLKASEVQKNIADNLEKSHVQNIDKTNVQEPRQVPELAKNEEIKEKVPSQALSANDLLKQYKKTTFNKETAPGATPTPTPTVEPFRKKDEPLVRKVYNLTPFIGTLTEKELSEKEHIEKANTVLKKAIESYPEKHINFIDHLKDIENIEERGNELVIYTENNEVSTLNKEYLKSINPTLVKNFRKWEEEMLPIIKLRETPMEKTSFWDSSKEREEKERKNKEIQKARNIDVHPLTISKEIKEDIWAEIAIPNPYVERERAYEIERSDSNSEVWHHNYKIAEIEEEKEEKMNIDLDDEEEKPTRYRGQGL